MRHRKTGTKLNRNSSHRRALFANMAVALIKHEQIETTLAKARILRPYVERFVTKARKGDMAMRRRLMAKLRERRWVEKLCDVLAPRYVDRPGGYIRIIKAGFRVGDSAPMAIIEFVNRDHDALGQDSGSPPKDKAPSSVQRGRGSPPDAQDIIVK